MQKANKTQELSSSALKAVQTVLERRFCFVWLFQVDFSSLDTTWEAANKLQYEKEPW